MYDIIWPSKKKLSSLREQGEAEYSSFALNISLIIFFLAYYLSSYQQLILNLTEILKAVFYDNIDLNPLIVSFTVDYIFLPSSFAIVIAFIIIYLQTRFLFKFHLIFPDLSRLAFNFSTTSKGLGITVLKIFFIPLSLLLIVLFLYSNLSQILALFNLAQDSFALKFLELFEDIGYQFLMAFILILPIVYLSTWFLFRLKNRMTEEDLKEEVSFAKRHVSRID